MLVLLEIFGCARDGLQQFNTFLETPEESRTAPCPLYTFLKFLCRDWWTNSSRQVQSLIYEPDMWADVQTNLIEQPPIRKLATIMP